VADFLWAVFKRAGKLHKYRASGSGMAEKWTENGLKQIVRKTLKKQ